MLIVSHIIRQECGLFTICNYIQPLLKRFFLFSFCFRSKNPPKWTWLPLNCVNKLDTNIRQCRSFVTEFRCKYVLLDTNQTHTLKCVCVNECCNNDRVLILMNATDPTLEFFFFFFSFLLYYSITDITSSSHSM